MRSPRPPHALIAAGLSLVLLASSACAETLVRERLKHDVGMELLGKAALYSFFYQYTPNRTIGLEAGFGALGGGGDDDNATIAFFPLGAKLYLIPKDGSLFLDGGITIVTAGTDSGPFDESTSFGHAGLGFEFRAQGGFVFRGTSYLLFNDEGWFIWPGLGLAYAF